MLISGGLCLLSACAPVPWGPAVAVPVAAEESGPGALVWWGRAVEASPASRESMLRNARQAKSAWRAAMLRSLPGGSETETVEASQEALRSLLRRGLHAHAPKR